MVTAHRALKGMLPDDFPYVLRVVSDILESNGSSSWQLYVLVPCTYGWWYSIKRPVSVLPWD